MSTRTPESFERHLRNVVAHCGHSWLVLRSDAALSPEYMVTPQTCKSNYCERCRVTNLMQLRRALIQSLKRDTWRLATLTFPDHSADPLTQLKNTYRQFKRLIQRLRRKYPHLKYVRTIELHQSGYPHIHCIFSRYIPVAILQQHWHELGGGIVDIRRPTSTQHPGRRLGYKQAARYLTEEIEKATQDPHNLGPVFWQSRCRCVASSRNIKLNVGPSPWAYEGIYSNFTDAMQVFQLLEWNWKGGTGPRPTITDNGNAVFIGPGYSPT